VLNFLLNLLGIVSLLIFLISATFWIRSYWRGDNLEWYSDLQQTDFKQRSLFSLRSSAGDFGIWCGIWKLKPARPYSWPAEPTIPSQWKWLHHSRVEPLRMPSPYEGEPTRDFVGFHCHVRRHEIGSDPYHTWTDSHLFLVIPAWFVFLCSAILPAWRFGGWKRRQRRHRLARGLCVTCGYDLRGRRSAVPNAGQQVHRSYQCDYIRNNG
jgi:hypothetical protein